MKKAFKPILSVILVCAVIACSSVSGIAAMASSQAKKLVLADAGLTAQEVTFTKFTAAEKGYDIEFVCSEETYRYTLSEAGEITAFYRDTNKIVEGERKITAQQAKSIALDFIGESDETAVTNLKAVYYYDEISGAYYEVSFLLDSRACTFKISAVDGSILAYGYEVHETFDSMIGKIAAVLIRLLNFIMKFLLG